MGRTIKHFRTQLAVGQGGFHAGRFTVDEASPFFNDRKFLRLRFTQVPEL